VSTLTKPIFPLVDPSGKPFSDMSPLETLKMSIIPSHKTINKGFCKLDTLRIKPDLIRAFLDLTELAHVTQCLISEGDSGLSMDQFGDVRNKVQHKLLSLPEQGDPLELIFESNLERSENSSYSADIYFTCRVAAILFSTHVTFPIPHSRRVRDRLLPHLQEIVDRNDHLTKDEEIAELLFWCMTVGGIAVQHEYPAHRQTLVVHFTSLCHTLQISSWTSAVQILKSFAWVDDACDEAGQRLWAQSCLMTEERPSIS
jgi:hypothetical protein